jgi:nucleoside diphosphate kinase
MHKLLLVSYNFPPVGGAGVQRSTKFVKYLRSFNWEPVVLTVDNPSVPVIDNALCKDIPEGIKIRRARSLEPSYKNKEVFSSDKQQHGWNVKKILRKIISYFLLPDIQVLWWPYYSIELYKIIKIERPDCIFVTAPPFSSFVPAAFIGSMYRIPVVLDYRDEWAFSRQQWENSNKSAWAKFTDNLLERYVIGKCSAITATNASYISSLKKLYPKASEKFSRVIPNGYDEDDFIGIESFKQTGYPIKIVYTGTVWKATSLNNIVAALSMLAQKQGEPLFLLDIYGRVVPTEMTYLTTENAKKFISIHGYVEHDVVVQRMHEADILLISLSNLPGAGKIITGKLFEYMATGKHIMAVVPDGETGRIVAKEYDNSTMANPDDVENIKHSFEMNFKDIHNIRNNSGYCPVKYMRKNLTESLAILLNALK